VLIDVVAVRMLQVTLLKVVDVVAMPNGSVPAIATMLMRMLRLCS